LRVSLLLLKNLKFSGDSISLSDRTFRAKKVQKNGSLIETIGKVGFLDLFYLLFSHKPLAGLLAKFYIIFFVTTRIIRLHRGATITLNLFVLPKVFR
jgi:hypothetical protein